MNRLAQQTSPYLLQHADNPVDWYPWGEEAFEAARQRDVPIFLSIGYSACHWCHVMAHESFEDEETAAIMNEHFVNIKIDREEYPVVDALYMDAVQAISGSGGWPMSVFVTPDGSPFYGGTYFPKESGRGRPSFTELLSSINNAWQNKRNDLDAQAAEIRQALSHHSQLAGLEPDALDAKQVLKNAAEILISHHDPEWGGIGSAPKFPQTDAISVLLWFGARGDSPALRAATTTLDAMASGGIYDHIGGGFSRYSTDAFWMVPHFEKMLYNQAQIARLYLQGFLLTGNDNYRQVIVETLDYVLRDLISPEGLFYAAEDADSEGEEGAFYLWRQEEIEDVCGANAAAALEWYGVTKSGNFEARNILHRPDRGLFIRSEQVEKARQALFDRRLTRVRPGLDNKVITEWNAMMISTLADTGRALGEPRFIDAATIALTALIGNGITRIHGGSIDATAADYAAVVDAATRVYEATGELRWLNAASNFAEVLLTNFFDNENGGVFSAQEGEALLFARSKDVFDGATASANSMMTLALLRLGALSGNKLFTNAAEKSLSLLARPLSTRPLSFTALLESVALSHYGITQVVIPGERTELQSAVNESFAPRVVLAHGEQGDGSLWTGREEGFAYVCHDFVCDLPTADAVTLAEQLKGASY